jgi:hypothetical protein
MVSTPFLFSVKTQKGLGRDAIHGFHGHLKQKPQKGKTRLLSNYFVFAP